MPISNMFKLRALLLFTVLLIAMTMPVIAGVPMPDVPKGKGDQCVEDTDFMRKNHMELILHQRDETMYKGIRTKKHSLKECIECHAVKDESNQFVSVASPKHFCRACHDYAAVKIDCFECHASKPKAASRRASMDNILVKQKIGGQIMTDQNMSNLSHE